MRQRWLLLILFPLFLCNCSRSPTLHTASGYIEGRYTYMATPVSGVLQQLFVQRGSRVQAGQQLYTLEMQPESDIYQAALQNLRESMDARDAIAANLEYARLTYERYRVLVQKNAIQQAQLDSANANYRAMRAQLAQANATIAAETADLAKARWTKDQKVGIAPVNALVFDVYYRLGEFTESNQPILSLLAPADIKAIFYIPERDLGALTLNEKVSVRCDGCAKVYIGRVSFISPSAEYTPPIIYSEKTNSKLIYRIEARFEPADAFRLHPGQPVIVTYPPHG